MRYSGSLTGLLNGIVVATLGACGGAAHADHTAGGGDGPGGEVESEGGAAGSSGSGGGAQAGRSGSGGGVQTAGSGSGGAIVVLSAGAGGASMTGTGSGGVSPGGGGSGGASVSVHSMPICDEGGVTVSFFKGLHLPQAVDYLGVYLNQNVGAPVVYQSSGTPCAGALDLAACQTALTTGAPSAGFMQMLLAPGVASPLRGYAFMYFAYTRGSSVGFIADATQLTDFLGEVDTANEAGLVFLSMGVAASCGGIMEDADSYWYSVPIGPVACSTMPPGQAFIVTHAGVATTTSFGTATPCMGRRPDGLLEVEVECTSPLGEYYAHAAHLEAAAVLAFEVMEDELLRFGAPASLRLRAARARIDEQRHARQVGAFAHREGASVPRPVRAEKLERSLLAAALENAVEGCVREAWGALSAHYQALTASEPEARQLWHDIARDESEHAELSFALHDWFMLQLSAEGREQVDAAKQRARLELRGELAGAPAPHPVVLREAGVPDRSHALALFAQLEQQLLSS